jgi:methylated-DNA-[protein]-cysteine S-methyltransferase
MNEKYDRGPIQRLYTLTRTEAGWIAFLSSGRGLLRCSLPKSSREAAFSDLGKLGEKALLSSLSFKDIARQMEDYFKGERVGFIVPLDLSAASPFESSVWEAARNIPYGEVRSYAWLASIIGKPRASRAVGQALGRNPLPIIIPCHRVLTSDGKLGGFSGGLYMKRFLLALERNKV